MELDQLRSFVAVAETRSFSRAAKLVHLSQPAISRQIARLERELGTKLFERYGRQVECTPQGLLLLPLAKNIVARTDEATQLMREHSRMVTSKVRFGSTGTVFAYLLPPVLASFLRIYPKLQLELVEREDSYLEKAVCEDELDCALVTAWGTLRTASYRVFTEEIKLVVPTNHRLARKEVVSLAEIADEPLILPSLSLNMGNLLMDVCRRAGFEPKVPYRANYVELTKAFVKQGMGIALLPSMFCRPEASKDLAVLSVAEHPTRDLHLIYPRERPLSPAVRAFMFHLRSSIGGQSQG